MKNTVNALAVGVVFLTALALTTPPVSANGLPQVQRALSPQPGLAPKAQPVLTEAARTYLLARDGDTVTAWVLFTDKGFTDRRSFNRGASAVTLTERARNRRAKVGLDKPVFADLPVAASYLAQIQSLGADLRRTSRWLNAASFRIPADALSDVAALPFVAEIRPLHTYTRPNTELDNSRAIPEASALGEGYAQSEAQLAQINAIAAHEAGWTGEGVTLAIMDTGFRKTHEAFALHWSNGRVLAEWDFVQNDGNTANEGDDASNQWNHGTYIWSVAAGERASRIYGPGYRANIILCKTEDVRSETHVEEDNWVAALEFADSVGTDVITTSLGYLDFDAGEPDYTASDMDGATATISIAASTCAGLGIVMCNSMGNSGPWETTLTAPADAFDILSVGNVSALGVIAPSSSRGPTVDGRIKPEVCARGTSTRCATTGSDDDYGYASGTSLSTPLIAGAACQVIQAHPDWTPLQVREALMQTADNAYSPNNDYGWGVIDVMAAIAWDPSGGCCLGPTVGNIDGSEDLMVTMGDLTVLIDRLFISLEPFTCPTAADLDQSGQPHPLTADITVGDMNVLLDHLFITLAPLPACQ